MTRMGYLGTVLEVARQTAVLQLRSGMFRLLLLALALVAVALFVAGFDPDGTLRSPRLYAVFCWWLLAMVLLPWTTMYFGIQAVHGDIEDRTFQYLFVRPVARSAVLLGKWLATAVIAAGAGVAGAALLYATARLHPHLWEHAGDATVTYPLVFAATSALLGVAYAALAAWFGAMWKRPMVWAAGYVVAQMLLANMPAQIGLRALTIADPARRFALGAIDAEPRLARMLWVGERNWAEDLIGRPLQDLAVLVGTALALALASYTRSEYDSRERE